MKLKVVLIISGLILLCYLVVNITFKVNYASNDVATLDSLKINDSLTIPNAYIVLGRNYKGFIEATVLPTKEYRYYDRGIVEYYYLRFHPKWFKANIAPKITSYLDSREKLAFDLVQKAKIAHQDNFDYCCHFNDYPVVDEDVFFARISLLGVANKVTMFANASFK
jgi:hypothetical protein